MLGSIWGSTVDGNPTLYHFGLNWGLSPPSSRLFLDSPPNHEMKPIAVMLMKQPPTAFFLF